MSVAISFLFYLLILFLPTQLGLHFWPSYTNILGVRIDYLSPTFYFTDLLIGLLFVSWLFRWLSLRANEESAAISFKNRLLRFARNDMNYSKVFIFLFSLVIGIIFSKVPQLGLYGFVKILELIFLGYYTAIYKKLNMGLVSTLLSVGILFESSLAIAQYLSQGSIGGIFYFFGERFFNPQTPGIANASLNGALVLRPYATFPHPNVLAGYLLVALQLVISNFKFQISNFKKLLFGMAIILGSIALFLTMSRIAILLYLIFVAYWLFIRIKTKRILYLLIGLLLAPLISRFTGLKLTDESIVQRTELNKAALIMIKDHPIFGVGSGNFLVNLPDYLNNNMRFKTFFLQPVHNIYLFIASETGIVGLVFFMWFVFKTVKQLKAVRHPGKVAKATASRIPWRFWTHSANSVPASQNDSSMLFIILLTILVIGLFDHYFITLQQGQLLFSFVLGLCYNSSNA